MKNAASFKIELTRLPLREEAHSGSALLIVPGVSDASFEPLRWASALASDFATYVLVSTPPESHLVEEYASFFRAYLLEQKIRRLTLLGIGSGSALVQALAVSAPKLVRRVVLINACSRIAPSVVQRMLDWLESKLPLGLPLRANSAAYDSRPMLHRIHCPVLALTTCAASTYEQEQSKFIARRIPNCWSMTLAVELSDESGGSSSELRNILLEFAEVPVKCPQKVSS